MITRIVGTLLGLCLCWLGLVLIGLDRGTAVAADTPLSRVIVSIVSGATFVLIVREYFQASPPTEVLIRLKRERKAVWIGYGLFASILFGAASAWISDRLLRTVAQHAPASTLTVSGTVTSVRRVHTSRRMCLVYVSIRSPALTGTATVCMETWIGMKIGPDDLAVGQSVRLQIANTRFGIVVEHIDHAG